MNTAGVTTAGEAPPLDVLVVGAGTTGLTLALQAHENGARVRIIERRAEAFRPTRALMMHPRTLEVLRPLGVARRILAEGDGSLAARLHLGARVLPVGLAAFDLAGTAFPHLVIVPQAKVEAVLAEALHERGIEVERGTALVGLRTADATRAVVEIEHDGVRAEVACRFVAGCDGPESTVRRLAGIRWAGRRYRREVVLADLDLDGSVAPDVAHVVVDRRGLLFLFALGERAPWRMLATRRSRPGTPARPFGQPGDPVPQTELQRMLVAAGLTATITRVAWSARVALQHRLADHFRAGRLFLAGDAAHAHSPAGGQGMNAGIQDAVNLGWKLAFAARATEEGRDALLDSYERERRPIDRRILALTHVLFWAESGTGPVASIGRSVAAAVGAPLLPFLLRRRRLAARGVGVLSQLGSGYRRSPLSRRDAPRSTTPRSTTLRGSTLRAGSRLPDGPVLSGGRRVRLHELTAAPGIHLLLQAEAAVPGGLGPHVRSHRIDNWRGRGIVVVRPDGYIGMRTTDADERGLRDWLALVGLG